ncbi:trypsin-like peptidase domain-containing protein [Kribbella sp. NPDC020789]
MAGSAFIVGTRGYALTAGHCLPGPGETLAGLFLIAEQYNGSIRGRWALEPIATHESHPREDVGILRLTTPALPCAFLRLSARRRDPETEYQSWGYPERGYDYINVPEEGRRLPRPDLIYTKGYVRRVVDRAGVFPSARGSALLEVSEVAGAGCSGSPVVEYVPADHAAARPKWAVIGIYIGEQTRVGGTSVGVVASSAGFGTWEPTMLGHSLIVEANPTPEQASAAGMPETV